MNELERIFIRLNKSKFRSKFQLTAKDHDYIAERGLETIKVHADDFVRRRLAPAEPRNDGKQTPFKGHPVFIAQHATATCCRNCLSKWHRIAKGKQLTDEQIQYLTAVIMRWIENEAAERF